MLFKRRAALQLSVSGVGVGLLAACTSTAPAAPTAAPAKPAAGATTAPAAPAAAATSAPAAAAATAAPAAKPTAAPKNGGTLRIGITADINRLDAHFRISDVYYQVYDRLTQYDDNLKPQPMLAESWDISPDGKQYKFNLRKGVMFHSGKEVDSAAIKYNSERARDLVNTQLAEAKWWNSIETPDKYTVIFKSDLPRPVAFDYFEYLNIADPATADDPTKAIGTGPYKFVEWVQGKTFTLTKNPNYWLTGRPYMDGIVASVITDPQAMTTAFEAGSLDAVQALPSNDYLRLRDKPGYVAYKSFEGNVSTVGVHTKVAPWDNKKARQALFYAVNRERWTGTMMQGLEPPSALPWTPDSPAYDEAKANKFKFNLDTAKQMLKEAGVTGTYNQELIMGNGNAQQNQFSQVLQADMAQLGINLTIKPQDAASYLALVNNGNYNGLWLGGGSFCQLDPGTALTKSRAFSPEGNSSAFTAPANAAAVALVTKATTEYDPAKRKAVYDQINDMLLDEAYIFAMSPTASLLMTTAKVKDLQTTKHAARKWWNVWLDA